MNSDDINKPKKEKRKKYRINAKERKKVVYYLKEFYKCYPYEKFTIFHAVKYFKYRLKNNNKDAWVGVAGDTGSGKSLYCLMFMILFGRPMNLTDNVAYIPKGNTISDMFDKLNFQTLLIDEAAREMRSVNWQSKGQQGVNVKAMTDRFKNNMVFLNMPNFMEFTKSMRRSNLQFRMIIISRNDLYARVVVQRKSKNWRSEDPWGDTEAVKKYEKAEKRQDLDDDNILAIERSLPSTVMDFLIPNITLILPDFVEEYETLKTLSRAEAKEEEKLLLKKDKYKDKYSELLNNITKLLFYNKLGLGTIKVTKNEMANSLGISQSTFEKYLKKKPIEKDNKVEKVKSLHKDETIPIPGKI